MAVKINRGETSLRDNLNQSQYGTVPYEKMPSGSVIQTQYTMLKGSGTANESETSSSTYQPTTFTVKINPRSANSIFKIESCPNIKSSGDSAYHSIALYKKVGSTDWEYAGVYAHSTTTSTTPHGSGTNRFNTVSAGWWSVSPILFYDEPNTLEEIEYKLYHRNSNNGAYTVRVGENGADEFISVQEIKR